MKPRHKKIRVVQVGVGKMGKIWLDILLRDQRIQVVGLADIDNKAIDYCLSLLKNKKILIGKNYKEIIFKTNPDFVLDVTPPKVRCKNILFYLKNNLNVLSEKPLVSSKYALSKIRSISKKSNSKIMISQNYRWHSGARFVKKLLDSGTLGEISDIKINFANEYQLEGWRSKIKHPFLLDMAIHHFDLIRFFTNSSFVSISCRENNIVNAVIYMSKGETVNYSGTWSSSKLSTPLCGRWIIRGKKGIIIWNGNYEITLKQQNKINKYKIDMEKKDKLQISLNYYITSLINNSKPIIDLNEHSLSLNMVFAACSSTKNRTT